MTADVIENFSPPKRPRKEGDPERSGKTRYKVWKVIKWLFLIGCVFGVFILIAAFVYYIRATKDLPTLETLAEYKPPVMTRVHAGDGKLITEFSKQARVFVPVETIPKKLQLAFVAAEDKRFYTHNGWDPIGLTRAALSAPAKKLKKQRIGGTSTITQQVAKNFLVGDDYSMTRKVREIAIARRMEEVLTKDDIIELYLNEIYFGRGAYGVAAASLKHFGKPMKDLSLAQMTYLASVPKGPSNYRLDNPKGYKKAKQRQSYILGRMLEDGYISKSEADDAKAADLDWVSRLEGDEFLAADYFVEEARKKIYKLYGQDELYSGGLSIRTTLDTKMQLAGRRALRRGIERFDRRHGYRGPLASWENLNDWKKRLAEFEAPKDVADWRLAAVLDVSKGQAKLGFAPDEAVEGIDNPNTDDKGVMKIEDIDWAAKALPKGKVTNKPTSVKQILKVGDIILAQRKAPAKDGTISTEYNLRQVPKVNGGLIAMDPHTGRVLSLIGGYSFEQSEFNRATQAYRQPGSAFKPFVYAAALQNGYTPASQVLDAPFVIERQDVECEENELGALELRGQQEDRAIPETEELGDQELVEEDECERFYKPSNYNAGKFYGLSTLRLGLEKSRNAMTVRLANDIGMRPIIKISKDFGIYDDVKSELAWALGAGETNLMRLAAAYSMMINGGKDVTPAILDRVQDGSGKTVFLNDQIICDYCQQDGYTGGPPPELPDNRRQVIDPVTAYQVTFMMQGVVENGTGFRLRALDRPLGGKTGTTNDSFDAWFMGFSPDLVVGVYIGMDNPEQMGNETGSSAAAPVVTDFMREVLADVPKVPFRIPEGVTLAPINRTTGEPSYIGAPDFILEAFRPGTEPSLGGLSNTIRVGSGSEVFGISGTRRASSNDVFDEFSYDDDFATEDKGETSTLKAPSDFGPNKLDKTLGAASYKKPLTKEERQAAEEATEDNSVTARSETDVVAIKVEKAAAQQAAEQTSTQDGLTDDAAQGLNAAEAALRGLTPPTDGVTPADAAATAKKKTEEALKKKLPKKPLVPKTDEAEDDLDDGLY